MWYKIGQIIGWIAVLEGFMIFLGKNRGQILIGKMVSDALWVANMLMIGAYTGAALNGICICREAVFYQRGRKKWASSPLWLVFFGSLILGSCFLTWNGWISIIPTVGSLVAAFSFYSKKPQVMRVASTVANLLWLIYQIYNRNLSGIVGSVILLISAAIGFVADKRRSDRQKASEA